MIILNDHVIQSTIDYILFIGNTKVYTGPATQLTYTVSGLQYYTQYTFSVEACTNRGCQISQSSVAMTLEALPEGQPQPTLLALADELGAHAGIQISWEGPVKPNGIIVGYELRRRSVLNGIYLNTYLTIYFITLSAVRTLSSN